jgi:hypothetical protein
LIFLENEVSGMQELTVTIQTTTYTLAADNNFNAVVACMSELSTLLA